MPSLPAPSDVFALLAALLASVGTAGGIILALSGWLGKVWANRIADRERATFAKDLEQYRHQLSELAAHQQDALVRRRDVYAALSTSMRVLLGSGQAATDEQKREFLRAYDQSCLWASEGVADAIGELLDGMKTNVAAPGTVSQARLQDLYASCILAMRRDSGFPATGLNYRVVRF